jgi:hypothetical protein
MKLMTLSLALAASFAALAPTAAHADLAGDRVVLVVAPSAGCPTGQASFRRLHQSPDGAQSTESVEFQVPAGKYLEITNIEYSVPYYTGLATMYAQYIDLYLRSRTGPAFTYLFNATYSNAPIFDAITSDNFATAVAQYASPGAQSHVAAFPAGPLVGNLARVCLGTPSNFFNYGGRFQIRGRLIPADPTPLPTGGGGIGAQP